MFQTFRNAWKIPELKNRLLFTLAILVVYRLGCAIPVPFITGSALSQMFSNGNMLSYLDMMSGGALSRCTLFALGVTPYINASIIVQLLTVAIPSLENIAKEPDGQNKLQQITRYAGGVIALVMSLGYYFVVRNMGALKYTTGAAGIFTAVVIIATFTAGAQLITWCGEQIDDKVHEIFKYTNKYDSKISAFFKKHADGLKIYTCHYCDVKRATELIALCKERLHRTEEELKKISE